METNLLKAIQIIKQSKHCIAYTGAGISVESGIPPFRGENSIWNRYDPKMLDLEFFIKSPEKSWPVIKEIFYDFFGKAKPNAAHVALAQLEGIGILKCIITQNIDNLHQNAGSNCVLEFHGNSQRLVCIQCSNHFLVSEVDFSILPLKCKHCGGLIKPDFVFFGEAIQEDVYNKSVEAAREADVCLIIGSTGEVMPAATIPYEAKRNGAIVIEINPAESQFTFQITDIHLKGKAATILSEIGRCLT